MTAAEETAGGRGGQLAGADLRGRDLGQADLRGADLRRAGGSLRGATLAGSRWSRAAIVGTDGVPVCSELAEAAVAGRDRAEVMLAPAGLLRCVGFSPDGSVLAIGADAAVWLVGVAGWTSLRILSGHTGAVRSVRFSPDGTLIVSGAADGTVRTWEARTGDQVDVIAVDEPEVRDALFAAGGAITVRPRDVQALSPDGSGYVRVFEEPVPDPRFPHDIDSAMDSCVLEVNGREASRYIHQHGPAEHFGQAGYSPDGTLVAVDTGDRRVGIWDTVTWRWLASIDMLAYAFAFSPDNTRIAIIGTDGAGVWDTRTGQRGIVFGDERDRIRHSDRSTMAVAFSPDGALVVAAIGSSVQCWDSATGELRGTLGTRPAQALAVACSPDGETVATTSADGTIRLWDTGSWAQRSVLRGHQRSARGVAFSPDGAMIATASGDGEVRLWEAGTGKPRATFTGEPLGEYAGDRDISVAFSPDGGRLGVCRSSATIEEWDVRGGGGATYRRPMYWKRSGRVIRYSPAGQLLAVTFGERVSEQVVEVREAATRRVRARLYAREGISSAALSPDGNTVLVGGWTGTAWLWRLPGGRRPGGRLARGRLAALWRPRREPAATFSGQGGRVSAVAFSPDGTLVAAGSSGDCTVRVWVAATAELIASLPGHHGTVTGIAIGPGNGTVVSASLDGIARVWDIATASAMATLVPLPSGGYATLFPDGRHRLADPGDAIWWAIKLCRFAPGELESVTGSIT